MRAVVHVADWERVSLWRRILGAFVRVTILIAVLVVLFDVLGPPIGFFFTARSEGRKVPAVKITPEPLRDYSVSEGSGSAMSYLGYKFATPWSGSYKQKGTGVGRSGIVALDFESGQSLIFIAPENQSGLLSKFVQDPSLHVVDLQPVLGDLTSRSAYDQYSLILNTTPRSVRAFGPRTEAVRAMTLLTVKAIVFGPELETGAFSFELPDKRGFQIGDPRKAKRVDLEIFDRTGHHVEMFLAAAKDKLSQSEINRVLTSFHAAADESPEAPAARPQSIR